MFRRFVPLACLLLVVPACHSEPHYVGVGDVVSVHARAVTIHHDGIDGLMEAGTTRFTLAGDAGAPPKPGERVRFELRRGNEGLVVTKATAIEAGNPGVHDHTPHHGGVVAMVGMIHLEAKASPDGRVRLYLTDLWRRPLPLDDVHGSVTLDLPEGPHPMPLTVADGDLEAAGPPLAGHTVNAAFALQRADGPVEVRFLLPLGSGDTGAAGVPLGGCLAPTPNAAAGRMPRCTLGFANPVVALAVSPDAATLLVTQVDLGTSAWRLPAAEFLRGFAPPPPVAVSVAEPPHPEAPNAVLFGPDGRDAIVALENRLIRYAMQTGQAVRAFDGPGGIVRAVAWSPDGTQLLVSAFYNGAGFLLDAGDGRVQRRFPVEREAAAVAFSPDGQMIAVASEPGAVSLFSPASSTPLRVLSGARGPMHGLAFVGDRLVAAGEDGVLRIWDSATGALQLERRLGPTLHAMAVDPERGLIATVGIEPRIQLTGLTDGQPIEVLSWHTAQILDLVWGNSLLASGDAAGKVALWDITALGNNP